MVVSASASKVRTPPFRSTAPVTAPTNDVAVNAPELELKVRLVPDFGAKSPVAAGSQNILSADSHR